MSSTHRYLACSIPLVLLKVPVDFRKKQTTPWTGNQSITQQLLTFEWDSTNVYKPVHLNGTSSYSCIHGEKEE